MLFPIAQGRIIPSALFALSALVLNAAPALAQAPNAQVMVLGVYHMDNPGLDYANPAVDDVLVPRRQAEIEALARALAEFRPTRIAVEAEPARDSAMNARYRGYLGGSYTLTRDERDQIGMRLGRMLGHERLYMVDYRLDMDLGATFEFAAQNGQGELVQRMTSQIQTMMAAENEKMATSSVGAILADANSARADSMHGWYMVMATVGRDSVYRGAAEVGNWYVRNLHIFANIARVAQPGERVLVIMGAGHGTLLRQFIDESPDLDLVPAEPLLARFRTATSR